MGSVITSSSNPRLRLIHRLLESRRQREREGLFVVEGEDLVQAADDAGIEPVEVLRAGEDVEPDLLAKISTMAHPPRVIALYRGESLPRGVGREGVPDDVVAACDDVATIQLAPGAESLNVAVAGAIALYEHRRRR